MDVLDMHKRLTLSWWGAFNHYAPQWMQRIAAYFLAWELWSIDIFQKLATDKWMAAVLLYFFVVGVIYSSTFPLSFARVMVNFTPLAWPFRLNLKRYRPRHEGESPSWLVITGPTGELGEEFALQFAAKGFSLFLIGRSQEKLDKLAEKLKKQSPKNQYEVHALDLEKPTEEEWSSLEKHLTDLPGRITVLLNNAGVSHRRFVQFERTSVEDLVRIPSVNIIAVLRITRMIVPQMVAERRGLIINIGSFSSHVPAPLLATYGGSKAFLYTWSQALGAQLDVKNVQVRVLNTYYVTTQMSRMKQSLLVPSARTYVKSAISTLGLPGGAVGKAYVSTPFIGHAVAQWFTDRFWTEWLWMRMTLRQEQHLLRKSINKRRSAEGESTVPLNLKTYGKEVMASLGGPRHT